MTNLKEKLTIVILLAFLLFAGIKYYTHDAYMKSQYEKADQISKGQLPALRLLRDENGKLHGQVEVMEVDRRAYIISNKVYLDSIAKLAKIKPKNIQSIANIGTKTGGEIATEVGTDVIVENNISGEERDTVIKRPINYTDQHLDFNGYLKIRKQGKDSFFAKYTITDSLQFITSFKNTGFLGLGKKKMMLDVTSSNPNMTFVNASKVDLKDVKDKKWAVTVGAYYGYDGDKFRPFVGAGVSRIIFKF